eukprot:CAMPEP_0113487956 /NCGR_PEP_ID=MMETSP0014_2-20120614/25769_1 /TAXON_ID=2857 /ORGANISM="Nitzschia sp." /LENGTH=365 /DNA_ID=CAMNT_0000381655 /DNA_START=240 /DNA_END=1340 /DNA_ORIENTATION=- /assembly_acc=CAM_ASM_000159
MTASTTSASYSATSYPTAYPTMMSPSSATTQPPPSSPTSSFAFAQPPPAAAAAPGYQPQYQQQTHTPQYQHQQATEQQQLVPMYGPPPSAPTNPTYNNYSFDAQQLRPQRPQPQREPSIYTVAGPPPAASSPATSNNTDTVDLLDDFLAAGGGSNIKSNSNTNVAPSSPMSSSATTSSTQQPLFSDSQAKALEQAHAEARDREFVSSLSPEILAEQRRLYSEIQAKNRHSNSQGDQMTVVRDDGYNNNNAQILIPTPSTDLVVPPSSNPTGSDAVVPTKYQMKSSRKVKMGAGAVGGAVVGGVLFGPAWPLGAVAGGAAGAYGTKQIAKVSERRAQRKYEQRSVQQQASNSIIAHADENDATAFA